MFENPVYREVNGLVRLSVFVGFAEFVDFSDRKIVGLEVGIDFKEYCLVAVSTKNARRKIASEFFGRKVGGYQGFRNKGQI